MANSYGDRTHCNHGHEFTPENTRWRSDRSGRICKTCKREREARRREVLNRDPEYRAARRLSDRLAKRKSRGTLEADDVAKYDDKKTAVQRVLGVRPEAAEVWAAMNAYLDDHRTPCKDRPDEFIDYDDPRYPEEQTGRPFPSTSQAEALCSDCKIRTLCLEFGLKNREDFGVYGGKRLVNGRIYQGGSGRTKKEEK